LTEKPYRERIGDVGLILDTVNVIDPFELSSPRLSGDITLKDFSAKDISLDGGKLDGSLTFTSATLQALKLVNVHITGDLAITNVQFGRASMCMPHGNKSFDATMAQVDGATSIVDSHAEEFDLPAASFGRRLFVHHSDANVLDLSDSRISSNASLIDNVIRTEWYAPCDLTDDPTYLVHSALNMDGVVASSNVELTGTEVHGPASLSGASIDGSLILTIAHFYSLVDLSDSKIGKKLVMDEVLDPEKGSTYEPVHWEPDSMLRLRDATVGTIAARQSENIWPNRIDILNLNFVSYSGESLGSRRLQDADEWFPGWLAKSSDGFNPQTYERVRLYLVSVGEVGAATKVGFAGKTLEFLDSCQSGFFAKCLYLAAYGATTGFGFYPWFAAIWTLLFVYLGAQVFRRTPEAVREHMTRGYAYSFDTFLPLVRLRERNYDIDIEGKARYYFYFHKLAGWVLGSFLVAAISGIAR